MYIWFCKWFLFFHNTCYIFWIISLFGIFPTTEYFGSSKCLACNLSSTMVQIFCIFLVGNFEWLKLYICNFLLDKFFSSASCFVNIGRGQIYSAFSLSDGYREPIHVHWHGSARGAKLIFTSLLFLQREH